MTRGYYYEYEPNGRENTPRDVRTKSTADVYDVYVYEDVYVGFVVYAGNRTDRTDARVARSNEESKNQIEIQFNSTPSSSWRRS